MPLSRVRPGRIRAAWQITHSRWTAADPGRARLRFAVAATVGLCVTAIVEYVYGRLFDHSTGQAAMMLGSVAAMQIAGSLMQPTWQQRARVVRWHPVATGTGIAISLLAAELGGLPAQLILFIAVTFGAVAVRRYGPPFATLGLMGWVAYFICVFIAPPLTAFLFLLGAEILSAATVFGLSLLLWGHRPVQGFRHAAAAWESRTNLLLRTAAQLVRASALPPHARIRMRSRLISQAVQLADTALLVDGWLGELKPQDNGWHPATARGQLLEAQLAVDAVVDAIREAISGTSTTEVVDADRLIRLLDLLATGDDIAAAAYAHQILATGAQTGAIRPDADTTARVAVAGLDLIRARRPWGVAEVPHQYTDSPRPAWTPPAVIGTAGPRWQDTHRLPVPLRQAIQATLAMTIALPLGYWISPIHYTWALVAVFMVFLGPSTRGEIAVKAMHRAVGTIAGLVVAVPVALVTTGRPAYAAVVIVAACFVGHYLMEISYAYLMFCITVAVLQLYELMGEFTAQLLVVRLSETLLGAATAVIVAFFVLPIRTRDATAFLARGLFHSISALLGDLADRIESGTPIDPAEISGMLRAIDASARRHRIAGAPLVWHPRRRQQRQLVNINVALLADQVRAVTTWVTNTPDARDTAPTLRMLAADAARLAQQNSGQVGVLSAPGSHDLLPMPHHRLHHLHELLHGTHQSAKRDRQ